MRRNGLHRVPESFRDLLSDESRALAYLATLMPSGTPQLTPLWFDTDGDCIRINTARGRVKDRNMRARPAVALVIQDRNIDNRYIQIRGHVAEVTETGALDHIDHLALKYRGTHWKPVQGQVRVTYTIAPDSISVYS